MTESSIEFKLNGKSVELPVLHHETLLSVLRTRAAATDVKSGCDRGDCGACAIILNGQAVNSCLTLAVQADGKDVITVRGLAPGDDSHELQDAFLKHGAAQCGICIPGMLVSLSAYIDENPEASRDDLRAAASGNLCRCTGYQKIIDAAETVVRQRAATRS